MWLAEALRRRTYKRNFNAAVVVYLGIATYPTVGANERTRVDAHVAKQIAESGMPMQTYDMSVDFYGKAILQAIAMSELSIPPMGGSLKWKDFLKLAWLCPDVALRNQFHLRRPATQDAIDYLRGYAIPIFEKANSSKPECGVNMESQ